MRARWVTLALGVAIALLAITLRARPSHAATAFTLSSGEGVVEHAVVPSGIHLERARAGDDGLARTPPLAVRVEHPRVRAPMVTWDVLSAKRRGAVSPTRARALLMVFLN